MRNSKASKKEQPQPQSEPHVVVVDEVLSAEEQEKITSDTKFVIELIRALYKLIRRSSLENVIDNLKRIENNVDPHKEDVDYIINSVCSVMKVSRNMLTDKKHRKEVANARKYVILFLRKYTTISDSQAGFYIKRSRQVIYNTEKEFDNLDPKNKFDAKFLKTYNLIDSELQKKFVEQQAEIKIT